jgi:hypothetical protein
MSSPQYAVCAPPRSRTRPRLPSRPLLLGSTSTAQLSHEGPGIGLGLGGWSSGSGRGNGRGGDGGTWSGCGFGSGCGRGRCGVDEVDEFVISEPEHHACQPVPSRPSLISCFRVYADHRSVAQRRLHPEPHGFSLFEPAEIVREEIDHVVPVTLTKPGCVRRQNDIG